MEEITQVPGVGRRTAAVVVAALAGQAPTPAVDPVTGEIVEPTDIGADATAVGPRQLQEGAV